MSNRDPQVLKVTDSMSSMTTQTEILVYGLEDPQNPAFRHLNNIFLIFFAISGNVQLSHILEDIQCNSFRNILIIYFKYIGVVLGRFRNFPFLVNFSLLAIPNVVGNQSCSRNFHFGS